MRNNGVPKNRNHNIFFFPQTEVRIFACIHKQGMIYAYSGSLLFLTHCFPTFARPCGISPNKCNYYISFIKEFTDMHLGTTIHNIETTLENGG